MPRMEIPRWKFALAESQLFSYFLFAFSSKERLGKAENKGVPKGKQWKQNLLTQFNSHVYKYDNSNKRYKQRVGEKPQ